MLTECFLDTNVLIYAATGRNDYPRHWSRAHEILSTGRNGLSGQVLAEFYVNATRPGLLDTATAFEWLRRLAIMPVVEIDADIVFQGVAMARRYAIAYWDGAILAAAQRLGATTLYTEDLNHGQFYEQVRVINPFREH
jgi:predicted nucleic acid-binding protein